MRHPSVLQLRSIDDAAALEAMARQERDWRICCCEWDGAPDATRCHTVSKDCPVHKEEAE